MTLALMPKIKRGNSSKERDVRPCECQPLGHESTFPFVTFMEFDLSPLWISLRTAGLATAIAFFIGIAVARWMLETRIKGKAIIEGLFIAPLVLPPTVMGFLLLLLLGKNGPLGQFLFNFDSCDCYYIKRQAGQLCESVNSFKKHNKCTTNDNLRL